MVFASFAHVVATLQSRSAKGKTESVADRDLVGFRDSSEPTLKIRPLEIQRLPDPLTPVLCKSDQLRDPVQALFRQPNLVAVQNVQKRRIVSCEYELSIMGIRLRILEELDQLAGEPRVKTRVDLIEQQNLAPPKSAERRS